MFAAFFATADIFSEGGPVDANLPGCGVAEWAKLLACQKDPKLFISDSDCIRARKKCRREEANPIMCPDLSKPPAWWFMEPGWFLHPPEWALAATDAQSDASSFVQEAEGAREAQSVVARAAARARAARRAAPHAQSAAATAPPAREGASSAAPRELAAIDGDGVAAQLRSQIAAMQALLQEQEAGIDLVNRGLEQAELTFARLEARHRAERARRQTQPPPAAAANGGAGATVPNATHGLEPDGRRFLDTLFELQQLVLTVMRRYVPAQDASPERAPRDRGDAWTVRKHKSSTVARRAEVGAGVLLL